MRAKNLYDTARERGVELLKQLKEMTEELGKLREERNRIHTEFKDLVKMKNFPRPHKSWKRISGPGYYWLKYITRDEVYILCIRDNQVVIGLLDPNDSSTYFYYRNYRVVWRGPQREEYVEAAMDLYERVAQPAPEE